jgi:hypothetical protein
MSQHQIHRKEAIKLITPVIDGEAAEESNRAFFQYIKQDAEVSWYYREEKLIKHLIRNNLPRYKAPSRLRNRIKILVGQIRRDNMDNPVIG